MSTTAEKQAISKKVLCEMFTQLPEEMKQAMEAFLDYHEETVRYLESRL